jgi:hypothetical protein
MHGISQKALIGINLVRGVFLDFPSWLIWLGIVVSGLRLRASLRPTV